MGKKRRPDLWLPEAGLGVEEERGSWGKVVKRYEVPVRRCNVGGHVMYT